MPVDLDQEQQLLVDSVWELTTDDFADEAFQWDGDIPRKNVKKLADHGFHCVNLPERYGGGGLTEFEALLVIETIGRVCPDTAYVTYAQSFVAPRTIKMFGSDLAKERYLPKVCQGKSNIAIAISEPQAGSDVAGMKTEVKYRDDGDMVLNGEKTWISHVPDSDAAVVWARFPNGDIGSVIMDFDAAGIDIVEEYENMAGHTQSHFFMEDVRIPEENVLISGEDSFKEQLLALNWERCGSAVFSNAMARCALQKAIAYAKDREQFDQPIGEFQGIRWKIASLTEELEAARSVTYQAIKGLDGQPPGRLDSCIANLYSGIAVETIVSESLQIFGATGYQKGHPLEYLYRLQRSRRIGAGTDEILKNQIADQVMEDGLPDLSG